MSTFRNDFPLLTEQSELIYLDSAATSQKPESVINAISNFYSTKNANPHRGGYKLSIDASTAFEEARNTISTFVKANENTYRTIFTKNATEAINLVAYSLSGTYLKKGDTVLCTVMEHHANLVPWQQLAKQFEYNVEFVPILDSGELDLETAKKLLQKKPKLFCFTHCSNVLGTINPAKILCNLAHENNALVLIDGTQAVPHFPVDLLEINADFYTFTGHKMLGPTGVGTLVTNINSTKLLRPFLFGGDMIDRVTLEDSTFQEAPRGLEAGTQPVSSIIGLAAACKYLSKITIEKVREHELSLMEKCLSELGKISGIKTYGVKNIENRSGVVSFNIDGVHPHDASAIFDSMKICVRSGDHCAQPLMKILGMKGGLRASFYIYNTLSDIDALIDGIKKTKKIFQV